MAPKKLSKPKGTYSKVGGVSGTKFTGSSPMDKFQNFLVSEIETMETRKERFAAPSRLYSAARKLGIPESKVKKQIDKEMAIQAKYASPGEKKSEDLAMKDMIRRSKSRNTAGVKTTTSTVNKVYRPMGN